MARDRAWWQQKEHEMASNVWLDVESLLDLMETTNRCVVPLFMRRRRRGTPDLVASGVLLKINSHVFLLSAAHVLEEFKSRPLLLKLEGGVTEIAGEILFTPLPRSGSHADDPIDAGVFVIAKEHHQELAHRCLSVDDLYTHSGPCEVLYTVMGYPLKKFAKDGMRLKPQKFMMSLQGQATEVYEMAGIDQGSHLVVESTKRVWTLHGIKQTPATTGISGGGVWIVPKLRRSLLPHRLVAIFIERRTTPPIMVATSIRVHLQLIAEAFEELRSLINALQRDAALDEWFTRTQDENKASRLKLPQEYQTLLRP